LKWFLDGVGMMLVLGLGRHTSPRPGSEFFYGISMIIFWARGGYGLMRSKVFVFWVGCFLLLFGSAYADFESDVIDLVNLERRAEGLHPLSYDARLAAAARDHSEDMGQQDYFSHDSLDGRKFYERILDAGYSYTYCAENIAVGYPNPVAVVAGWMDSPGHRANILDPKACDIGVGYALVSGSAYGYYWTQNFGRELGVSTCPGAATYTIDAAAGAGGSISPKGSVIVNGGSSLTFTITTDSGYSVQDVLVDGISKGIVLSYTFTKIERNHSIQVNFAPNNFPPIADAGSDQTVEVGDTITLDASRSSDPNDQIVFYEWIQTDGPPATLSGENAVNPTLVATPAMVSASLTFQLTVYDSGGSSQSDSVQIAVIDNGITGYPPEVITFYSITNKAMGIKVESGGELTSLRPMDPASDSISDKSGMPQSMVYGLIDFRVRVDEAGDTAGVTIFLPEPMPDGYRWYKYSLGAGWYDYSDNIRLNAARDRVTLTLVDGGIGDDDNDENGIIVDPSGLGNQPSSPPAKSSGSSGGGGCFIDSAADNSLKSRGVIWPIFSVLVLGLSGLTRLLPSRRLDS
jgi:hypothetical protein